MDAALTSSTSLISFRLEEVSRSLTSARSGAYWFMFEPLLMSKAIYDRLTKEQQAAIMAVGADLEAFARKAAQEDDAAVVAVYQKTNARVTDLNQATIRKWQDIARATAWKDYGERNANCARLLELAEKTLA
jgi:TRAP-type C4-dicarboxylate transport system substrate-binding protein